MSLMLPVAMAICIVTMNVNGIDWTVNSSPAVAQASQGVPDIWTVPRVPPFTELASEFYFLTTKYVKPRAEGGVLG